MKYHRQIIVVFALGLNLACPGPSKSSNDQFSTAFVKEAAEEERGEIVLGQLATGRASHKQVRQYGQHMLDDHTIGYQELQQLGAQRDIPIPSEPSKEKKEKEQEFSQLKGEEFDRAYVSYMIRDHLKDIEEFAGAAKTVKDPTVRQWAQRSLPKLKEHLAMAKQIAPILGIDPTKLSKLEK